MAISKVPTAESRVKFLYPLGELLDRLLPLSGSDAT